MRTAEYGSAEYQAGPQSVKTVIETRTKDRREYRLVHVSEGWALAGSCARYQDHETWAVLFTLDNATLHGRHFKTLAEARAMLDTWTKE